MTAATCGCESVSASLLGGSKTVTVRRSSRLRPLSWLWADPGGVVVVETSWTFWCRVGWLSLTPTIRAMLAAAISECFLAVQRVERDDGAPRAGCQSAGGGADGRGRDRRGQRRGRAQGPAGGCCQKGRLGRRRNLAGALGRGTLDKDKPPILGLIQRGGQAVMRRLANVQQVTIKPIIAATIAPGTLIHTDEYSIHARLPAWGYQYKTVCHGRGEYARDEDGDDFCEVHVDTIEGFWSLLRSWLRPHRGISQDKLPLYFSFFQFVHNARRHGRALLGALVATLVT